jgi:hypothetical protein
MDSKLEEFVFNNILSSSKDDDNLKNFNDFFWSQGRTLRRFATDALIEPDEIENAFKMSKLTELCVKGFHYNHELMEMRLEDLKHNRPPSKPASLSRFVVDYMDNILFELLAICAPDLKEMIVRRFEVDEELVVNSLHFRKLENLEVEHLDQALLEAIDGKAEIERTHFERMLLSAIEE